MKKAFFPLVFLFSGWQFATAQIYVEGVKITPDNTGQYLELNAQYRAGSRCAFVVDYGQANSSEDYVTDEHGERIIFRSLVDGLNTFYREGWEVAEISVMETSGRRYLLKRRF